MNNIDILEEKEKKAINNLNFIIVTDIYDNEVSIDKTKIINEYNESVGIVLNLVKTLIAENKELKKENKEIRDWKYVIDSYEDLERLKELDLIKIKGKEYISKSIYNELEKDKKALINNYSKVLGEFISKDKIKAKIEELKETADEDNMEDFVRIGILQSLLGKE